MSDLLVEIGTEELPPNALLRLSEAFSSGLCAGLEKHALNYNISYPFATPRRLAVLVRGVDDEQADQAIERRGPALQAAFDKDGKPTKAAQGFAKSCGVEVDDLARMETDKGAWLVFRSTQKGQPTTDLLASIVHDALAALPIPKRMRWGDSDAEFIRPVHWAVVMLGEQAIEMPILGIQSGNATRGHRFHHPQAIVLTSPDDYAKALEDDGKVIPVFSQREKRVQTLVQEAADVFGGNAVIDEDLLAEVTSLVEWPVAVIGSFSKSFLQVPAEALIAAMKGHQKFFHMLDDDGKLMPNFITVSNIESKKPKAVQEGNERVIRPRLTDAKFFWDQDRKHSLESRVEKLKTVIFEKRLGSLYDKSLRVAELSGYIAKAIGSDELLGIRVGRLSKCDLLTDMVNEFPELQGIMGEYYARHDGERDEVATALREYYQPRYAGDLIPQTPLGQAAALAERLDTLVGIFGIGQSPTGDKDPYALRRAAIGVIRIVGEGALMLALPDIIAQAAKHYPDGALKDGTESTVFEFILERQRYYFQDQGVPLSCVDAVLECRPDSPYDSGLRIAGVLAFAQLPAAESLAAANKRIHNILKKTEETLPAQTDPTYFKYPEERALFDALQHATAAVQPQVDSGDYSAALETLAGLRDSVDTFFDKVLVMDEDATIRKNRLALLSGLRQLFLKIADISRL
jgi:glycyl-tRNA synthetase beta chain